jgi:hypothetical protein
LLIINFINGSIKIEIMNKNRINHKCPDPILPPYSDVFEKSVKYIFKKSKYVSFIFK